MFSLEFGKIFRRKFNYLFAIIILLISFGLVYRLGSLSTYYDIEQINVVFNFIFKIALVLVIFLMGINFIYSYREDYISKVSVLLELGKAKTIRDFLSVISSFIYFSLYYLVIVGGIIVMLFFRSRNVFSELLSIVQNWRISLAYVAILLLMLLFANFVFLLMLSLFNNTNLAISLSLLYFVGGEVIATLLENRLEFLNERINNSILTIFSKTFNNWNQFLELNLSNFLPLILNIVGLVVVIFIVRLIKKIIM